MEMQWNSCIFNSKYKLITLKISSQLQIFVLFSCCLLALITSASRNINLSETFSICHTFTQQIQSICLTGFFVSQILSKGPLLTLFSIYSLPLSCVRFGIVFFLFVFNSILFILFISSGIFFLRQAIE